MFFTEIQERASRHSTPQKAAGGDPKIHKVGPQNFDDLSVWKAMMASPQTKIEKFDDLKHNPRVWIGQFESSIVAVGALVETHAVGVLPFVLQGESSKWFLTFDIAHSDATWQARKDDFIKKFEDSFAKKLRSVHDTKKANETIEVYAKRQIELGEKVFPSLTQTELNLFVMAGLDEKNIKYLKKQKKH